MKCGEYKIDLGCGMSKEEDFIGIDIADIEDVDIVRDIDKHGLPFCDNSATVIRANSFFEHLVNFIFVMNECWRVLGKDGTLIGQVPNAGSGASFRDPTHKRWFKEGTLRYFDPDYSEIYQVYGMKPWSVVEIELTDSKGEENAHINFKMKPYNK